MGLKFRGVEGTVFPFLPSFCRLPVCAICQAVTATPREVLAAASTGTYKGVEWRIKLFASSCEGRPLKVFVVRDSLSFVAVFEALQY